MTNEAKSLQRKHVLPKSKNSVPTKTNKTSLGLNETCGSNTNISQTDENDLLIIEQTSSRLKQISNKIFNSSCFNLFLILIVSILTNCLYFKFYYLPQLNLDSNHHNARKISYDKLDSKAQNQLKLLNNFNLITSSDTSDEKSEKNIFISYDHVVFPPIRGQEERTLSDSDENKQEYKSEDVKLKSIIDLNNYLFDKIEDESLFKEKRHESNMAVVVAINFLKEGKFKKAAKIYQYALSLDPQNTNALTAYAEYLEFYQKDILKAEHFLTRAVHIQPDNSKAISQLKRTSSLATKIDRQMFKELDSLLKLFYNIPVQNSALKRAKQDAYFLHIYHSNAIEGNTLNLQQTRHIIENRLSVGGKSVLEHNEVLGLDAAMRYINQTLLYRPFGEFRIRDILELHKRVLGFCDPIESGKFRTHQVFVGKFTPPHAKYVEYLMNEFVDWLNSNQLLNEAHPVQIAALAHYKFVFIHPFYDGNGRTGRLLMNLILMKFGYPPIIIRKEDRLKYYDYLEMANQGDIKPFVRFVARCTEITLKEYISMCSDDYKLTLEDDETKTLRNDLILNDLKNLAQFDFVHMNKENED